MPAGLVEKMQGSVNLVHGFPLVLAHLSGVWIVSLQVDKELPAVFACLGHDLQKHCRAMGVNGRWLQEISLCLMLLTRHKLGYFAALYAQTRHQPFLVEKEGINS